MFVDCYLVFRQSRVKHRRRDGGAERRIEVRPLYVCRTREDAERFSDALEEETGMPAPVSKLALWEEDGRGQG